MIHDVARQQRAAEVRNDLREPDQAQRKSVVRQLIDVPADHHGDDLVGDRNLEAVT